MRSYWPVEKRNPQRNRSAASAHLSIKYFIFFVLFGRNNVEHVETYENREYT